MRLTHVDCDSGDEESSGNWKEISVTRTVAMSLSGGLVALMEGSLKKGL